MHSNWYKWLRNARLNKPAYYEPLSHRLGKRTESIHIFLRFTQPTPKMIASTLQLIDDVAYAVKCKDDSIQTFSRIDMYKFELKLQLVLTIIRHELQVNQELSNATCIAINQLIVFQCFEYYKYQYPVLYERFLSLNLELQNYNLKYKNHELEGEISSKSKDWVRYFKNTLIKLFD